MIYSEAIKLINKSERFKLTKKFNYNFTGILEMKEIMAIGILYSNGKFTFQRVVEL